MDMIILVPRDEAPPDICEFPIGEAMGMPVICGCQGVGDTGLLPLSGIRIKSCLEHLSQLSEVQMAKIVMAEDGVY